jgi:hypothetical protein
MTPLSNSPLSPTRSWSKPRLLVHVTDSPTLDRRDSDSELSEDRQPEEDKTVIFVNSREAGASTTHRPPVRGGVSGPLEHTEKPENQEDDENEKEESTGVVTPTAAIWPGGDGEYEKHDDNDDQDDREHVLLLGVD